MSTFDEMLDRDKWLDAAIFGVEKLSVFDTADKVPEYHENQELTRGTLDFRRAIDSLRENRVKELEVAIGNADIMRGFDEVMRQKSRGLSRLTDACLYDVDARAAERCQGDVLVSNIARGDVAGQNMLIGTELAEMMTGGDAYRAAEQLIGRLPREQQQGWTDRLNRCHTPSDGQQLVGELYRKGVVEDYRKRKQVQEQNQERLDMLLREGVRGRLKAENLSPEDYVLLRESGLSWESLQRAYQVYSGMAVELPEGVDEAAVKKVQEAYGRSVYFAAGAALDDPQAQKLAERAWYEDARQNAEKLAAEGAGMKALRRVGQAAKIPLTVAENMISVLNPKTPAEYWGDKMYHGDKYQGIYRKAQELEGVRLRMRELADSEVANGQGLTPWSIADAVIGFGEMIGDLSNPVSTAGFVARMADEHYKRAAAAAPDAEEWKLQGTAAAYAVTNYLEAKIGLGHGTGLIARGLSRIPGGARVNGFLATQAARLTRTRPGAWLAAGAQSTADITLMGPAGGLMRSLIDATPLVDERTATGLEELQSIWSQSQTMKYWVEQGVAGFLVGGTVGARARREYALGLLKNREEWLKFGGKGEDFDRIAGLPRKQQMQARIDTWDSYTKDAESKEALIQRALKESNAQLDEETLRRMRGDNAVTSALRARGFHIEDSGDAEMVWLYTKGFMNDKGEFERGEEKIQMKREDAERYLYAVLHDEVERVADLVRELGARKILVDEMAKEGIDSEWMNGADSFRKMQERAARAQERVRELVENGMDEREARRTIDPKISEKLTLGALVDLPSAFDTRNETERNRSLDSESKQEDELYTRAYVVTQAIGLAGDVPRQQRILRIAHNATVKEALEEYVEQMAIALRGDELTQLRDLVRMRAAMRKSADKETRRAAERFLGIDDTKDAELLRKLDADEPMTAQEYQKVHSVVTEALSKIIVSDTVERAKMELPRWSALPLDEIGMLERLDELDEAQKVILLELQNDVLMAKAIRQAREAGMLGDATERILGITEDKANALLTREQPSVESFDEARLHQEMLINRFESELGNEVVHPDRTAAFYDAAEEGQEELDRAREEEDKARQARSDEEIGEAADLPANEGKSRADLVRDRGERYADTMEDNAANSPDQVQDDTFAGGRCVILHDSLGEEVRGGVIEVEKLGILPQFKLGADEESGVVKPLTGDYCPDHDPVRVWQKGDGTLLVVSGRHRLDACKRAGVSRIMCYVYKQTESRNEAWARRFDIESNIRDNQASALEVALYVRGEFTEGRALGDDEVARAGITREGKMGSVGYRIGRRAGEAVMDAFRNGVIDEREALALADAVPYDNEIQAKGLKMLKDGHNRTVAAIRMQAELAKRKLAEEAGRGGTLDLFGDRVDDEEFMSFLAQYVSKRKAELAQEQRFLGMNTRKKNTQLLTKYGVDVKDPDGAKKALAAVRAELERWQNPWTDDGCMAEIRNAWRELHPDEADTEQSVFYNDYRPMDDDTVTDHSVIGQKALTWDRYKDRAFTGRDDGMPRAEIDSSKAKFIPTLKPGSLYKNEVWKAKELLSGDAYQSEEYVRMSGARRLALVTASSLMFGKRLGDSQTWKDLKGFICDGKEPGEFLRELGLSEDSVSRDIHKARERTMDEYREARWQLAEIAGVSRKSFMLAFDALYGEGGNINDYARTAGDWDGLGNNLGDILDYPELYEAYPELRDIPVGYRPGNSSFSRTTRGEGLSGTKIIIGTDKTPEKMRGTLLHEIQHLIQLHEDFAFGGSASNVRGIFDKLGRLNELGAPEDAPDDYKRLSGEIEARAVSRRQFMSMEERTASPFNDSMEYAGNALTYRPSEYYSALDRTAADFSLGGMRAANAAHYIDKGLDFIDPADGQRKFLIDSRKARIETRGLGKLLGIKPGGHTDTSLSAILDFPALYEAYPELRKLRVRFCIPKMPVDWSGYACPEIDGEAPYICLNAAYLKNRDSDVRDASMLRTLLHEAQHQIQHIEGFSRGGNSMNQAAAQAYLRKAMAERGKTDLSDSWNKENFEFLSRMHRLVREGNEDAIAAVYWYAAGEQEARYVGEGRDSDVSTQGSKHHVPDVIRMDFDDGSNNAYTISITQRPTPLGGLTFANSGRFVEVMESRLAPHGSNAIDQVIYRMRESAVRRARELRHHKGGDAGMALLTEATLVMDSFEKYLPASYGFALEPYRVWMNVYANLHGTGSPWTATQTIPMTFWREMMRKSLAKAERDYICGAVRGDEAEFWHLAESAALRRMQEIYNVYFDGVFRKALDSYLDQGHKLAKARKLAKADAWAVVDEKIDAENLRGDFYERLGQVKMYKIVAKFMERVALQLDKYRKDVTLGRIRREIDLLRPLPDKKGKPVKGRMDAKRYEKVMNYVQLLELTRGEKERFEQERYTGENNSKAWADVQPDEQIEVDVYDPEGNPKILKCTKQEYEIYSCFDTMSASKAEAAARALGEFITTGKQAWENAQERDRERIRELCLPLMVKLGDLRGSTTGENKAHSNESASTISVWKSAKHKILTFLGGSMNDAQFLDALKAHPDMAKMVDNMLPRLARGKVYLEESEKDRLRFTHQLIRDVMGKDASEDDIRAWLDEMKTVGDSGVRLVEQMPDFEAMEAETVRKQVMGLLYRKTHKKNFNEDQFASALQLWLTQGKIPGQLAEEIAEKYGTIGEANSPARSRLSWLFTQNEYERFNNLEATIKNRAKKARDKWKEDKRERDEKLDEWRKQTGEVDEETLRITRAEAAYRVLLCEQADYIESLARQGYTDEVVEKLRAYAGKKMMQVAYALRDKLGERTDLMADMYERGFGMPFPRVENYFRAYFDAGWEEKAHNVLTDAGHGNAAGVGTAKVLYHRHHQSAPIDRTMDVFLAFECAMKEQDVFLGFGTLPQDMMRALNFKEGKSSFADAMTYEFGDQVTTNFKEIAVNLSQLAADSEASTRAMYRLVNSWSGTVAQSLLEWRFSAWEKQFTTLFNTLYGSDMVTGREWSASFARMCAGRCAISAKELMQHPALESRFKGWQMSGWREAMSAPGGKISSKGAADAFNRYGMESMEALDVWGNVRSCVVLYDAVYRKLRKQFPTMEAGRIDQLAIDEVVKSLAKKSQPLDWRSRSISAGKRSVFKIGNMFLGGESINTMANVLRLFARGKNKAAITTWLAHGVALQGLTAIFNLITDDEKQRAKRNLWSYAFSAVLGPLMGIPFVSGVAASGFDWLRGLAPSGVKHWLPRMYAPAYIPMGDLERLCDDISRVVKKGSKADWQEWGLVADRTVRAVGTVAAAVAASQSSNLSMRTRVYSLAAAGVANILDFLIRAERAVEQALD